MVDKRIEELQKFLEKNQNREILVLFDGFINSKIKFKNMSFNINLDVLEIKNDAEHISINLNQIYNIEFNKNEVRMYLDNDLIINLLV